MKNSLKFKRGFTLVEILIVIAIIGILASIALIGLGGSRVKARDAKRISEVRQLQTVLELYLNRCGYYPGPATCANHTFEAADAPADWAIVVAALKADTSITNIPTTDPSGQPYIYAVNTANGGQSYIIGATLEQDNAITQNQNLSITDFAPAAGVATCSNTTNNSGNVYCVGS